jgi:selenocysteine lyase/cysteine desulfurase
MVVINHASNVTGEALPAVDIGVWARARGFLVLLDAAQSIGHIHVDLDSMPFDAVAFGAHKGLRGPAGVGCLTVKDVRLPLKPLLRGGTGLESENLDPRPILPTAFEVGTMNMPAIAGLGAAIVFLSGSEGQKSRGALDLANDCATRLRKLPNLSVYGLDRRRGVPNVAFNVDGVLPERVASELDARFRIAVRAGLHCAPLTHAALGTRPYGSVRASFGYGNTHDDMAQLIEAVEHIARRTSNQ